MKAAVFGASGYGGQVLMRLLMDHPEVETVLPVSSSSAGSPVDDRDAGLGPDPEGKLPEGRKMLTRDEAVAEKPDVVFSALPHGASAEFCSPFFGNSVVFDLSADFRLNDSDVHKKAYAAPAPFPELRKTTVYGLAESYRDAISTADIIAVPGCYPTCVLTPILPLASAGLIDGPINVNALSGISGAGRSAKETSLYVERSENVLAYAPGTTHRHVPEMKQEIAAAGCSSSLFFVPHLVPMRRGMAATIAIPMEMTAEEAVKKTAMLLNKAYRKSIFINLRGEVIPGTRDVVGSNRCDIGWKAEDTGNGNCMLFIFSVIDNLVKGASGQAVQDFNIRFGFPEGTGLSLRGEV